MKAKPFAVASLAALLVAAGGAAALTGTGVQPLARDDPATGPRDVDVTATQQNEVVTVTVTADGAGVEDVTVRADGERVGTTDADGTVTLRTGADDEIELELSKGDFEGSVEYEVRDGTLTQVEEEYEYGDDQGDETDESETDESETDESETDESETDEDEDATSDDEQAGAD